MDEPIIPGLKKMGTLTITGLWDPNTSFGEKIAPQINTLIEALGRQFTLLHTSIRKMHEGMYELTASLNPEEFEEINNLLHAREKYLKRVRGGQRGGATLTSKQRRHARKVANARANRQPSEVKEKFDGITLSTTVFDEVTEGPGSSERPGERHAAQGAQPEQGPEQYGDRVPAGPGAGEPGERPGADRGGER